MVGTHRPGSEPLHPFVGRGDLGQEIDRLLDETAQGTGRGLLVEGPGGVGKSEFLRAAVERAGRRHFRIAVGRALPDELPAPFSLVRDLLESLTHGSDPSPSDEPIAVGNLPVLFVPVVDGLSPIPDRAGVDRGRAPRPAGDELERILAPIGRTTVEGLGAGRDRLYTLLVEHFLGLAREGPVLLAIDDLPLADPSSLEFLRRLAGEIGRAPIAVMATKGGTNEVPEHSREALAEIGRSPSFREVPLRPFTVAELAEFVTYLQGGTPPSAADVERWHAQTDGNPLFVEQIVRSTLGGGPRDAAVPGDRRDLVDVLLTRLRALDDAERRVLTYAAILGREFDFERLAAVSGIEEERLSEALDRLVHAGLLREKGGEVYEFVSEAVRASVYAELTETRRRILHRRAGAALEARGDASHFELARQFYLGRDYAKTVEYNLRAAESAARSFAFEAAISHLARALEGERRRSDRDPRREVRLLTEYGRLLHETGDLPRSQELLGEAVQLARAAPHPLELGRALLALAWTRFDQGEYLGAEGLATEAIGILDREGTPRDLLSAHRVLGSVYWRVADIPRAESHQRIALEIAEREGTPIERGHALVDVANTLIPQGPEHLEAGLAMYSRAADLFATAEDPSARARVLMNRAVLEYGAGRTDDAFRDLDAADASAEQSRSPLWIGYCLLNRAQWEAERGEAKAASLTLDRAGTALRPLHDLLAEQQIAMTRGMIAEAAGAYEDGEANLRDALAQARSVHLLAEETEVLFRLAQLSFRKGDRAAAGRWLHEATASGLDERRPDLSPRAKALRAAIRSAA